MEDLKELIKRSGLKKGYIADQLKIGRTHLSACLSGSRVLAPEKVIEIKQMCKKVIEISEK